MGAIGQDGKLDDVFATAEPCPMQRCLQYSSLPIQAMTLAGCGGLRKVGGYSYEEQEMASWSHHRSNLSADVPESIAFVECSASDMIEFNCSHTLVYAVKEPLGMNL